MTKNALRLELATYFSSVTFTFYILFQNEEIFIQLDELDKFQRITHVWIGFNNRLTQAPKTF